MEKKIDAIELRYRKIEEEFGNQVTILVQDIQNLFPDLEKNSLYWILSKMVKLGYLIRMRKGVYSINENRRKSAVFLSETAKKIQNILNEEGFEYYFTGIDVILKFMQHVPEEYPVMLFVEKKAEREIILILKNHELVTVKANAVKDMDEDYIYSVMRPDAVVYPTDNFNYMENNIAVIEKAFIDLFYGITRNYYPLSLQELARTYNNMIRLGAIDQKMMVTMSYKRNLQYDIRYIVESKYISEGAKEIVKYL